jgi:uncharacterized protein (DUF3820 family)
MDLDPLLEAMQRDLSEIGRTCMPFGKYGPDFHPPHGVPIYDLPAEYLGWFLSHGGFPKGRLGTLLQIVHQMKIDGSDRAFDVFRKDTGRTALRKDSPRAFDFGGP